VFCMKYLIVGLSVRAMVESAVRSGYSVIALDAFGDQDTRSWAETYALPYDFHKPYAPEALWECSRSLVFDEVAYTSNLENYPDILKKFAQQSPIAGNSPATVKAVRSWQYLYAHLKQAGFLIPETVFAGEHRNLNKAYRWLKKPLASGGGHGISFINEELIPDQACLFQQYIAGKACSASFVANGKDCVVLGITEQLIGIPELGAADFRYCGNLLPLGEMQNPDVACNLFAQVKRLAQYLTQVYGLVGLNGIDFILDEDRLYATEVNPRYSASMELMERAYDLPMFDIHLQAVKKGILPEFPLERLMHVNKVCGKAIIFADRDGKTPATKHWQRQGILDIPRQGEDIRSGNPICTLMTIQSNQDEAFRDLLFQAESLKREIYRAKDSRLTAGELL
jgi:uncharacterized protein